MQSARKKMLITGATKRIGKELALHFSSSYDIIIHYHKSSDEASDLKKTLEKKTNHIHNIIKCDLSEENEIVSMVEKLHELDLLPEIVINNAANFLHDKVSNITQKNLIESMQVNCFAPILLVEQLYKKNQGCFSVINIADYSAEIIANNFFSYNLSKAALVHATKMQAISMAPRLRVNALGPFYVFQSPYESEEDFQKKSIDNPLKVESNMSDIIDTINYFIAAKSVTGQFISLAGGRDLISSDYGI